MHLVLPHDRGEALVELGWAEPHQHGDFGTEYLIYGPRDLAEVDAVVSVIQECIAFSRG